MATRQQAKEPKASRQRGQAVGAVPAKAAAKGSAGGCGACGIEMVRTGPNTADVYFGPFKDRAQGFYRESEIDAAKSSLQMGVPEGPHTGEPVRQDRDATGAAAQGSVFDALASRSPSVARAFLAVLERDPIAGLHWRQSLGTIGSAEAKVWRELGSYLQKQNGKISDRTRGAHGAAFFVGVTLGVLLLGIAQAIYRG